MLRAREAGAPVTITAEATIADGIAVRRAGDLTLPLVSRYVDEIVTVDDEEIASAILMLLETRKDPGRRRGRGSSRRGLAIQDQPSPSPHRRPRLRRQHRRHACWPKSSSAAWSKTAACCACASISRTAPARCFNITQILARERANIVETIHNRAYYGVSLGETVIDVTLETRGATHIAAISHALREAGFRFERIQ